jgi:epoxyqueuosine reductase
VVASTAYTPAMSMSGGSIREWLEKAARAAGFDMFGVASVGPTPDALLLRRHVAEGRHGPLRYLERNIEVRCDPRRAFPWAVSIVCLGRKYGAPRPDIPPWIAAFARTRDYHDTIGESLRQLECGLRERFPGIGRIKAFVDYGPIAEKAWAVRAGLGFRGKNTLVIAPGAGSSFHLATVLLEVALPADSPMESKCGDCRRCLDACPTGALYDEWRLDASRCTSCLTIELKGEVPEESWPHVTSVFGCDACQRACPFNRAEVEDGAPADGHTGWPATGTPAELAYLITMTREKFDALLGDTPVRRVGWRGLRLNAIIAAGNLARGGCNAAVAGTSDASADFALPLTARGRGMGRGLPPLGKGDIGCLRDALRRCIEDEDPTIRRSAHCALSRIG